MSCYRVPVSFEGGRVLAPLIEADHPLAARDKARALPWGRSRRVLAVGAAVLLEPVRPPRIHRCPLCGAVHQTVELRPGVRRAHRRVRQLVAV